ncbi:FAD-dependent oxidoreductase [Desulfatirhabdium butyrativorans]|uniref:FAD-dependent oxidoreductase n=1 Tax=Desulfatirhabdium butyrativorans TaxID=340467 RepID=UPI0003F8C387|nr:FAD-dependent oxidoreductase [Desulfatirhabdium butyrativorans]
MVEALQPPIGSVLVVGGGIGGIQASLDLANAGYLVHLVESKPAIGGVMSTLDKTFPTNDCSMCILSPKLVEVGRHKNIRIHTLCDLQSVEGEAGRFTATLRNRPRYIDSEKCIACGKCAEKCPKKVPNAFNQELNDRKAAYVLYPQAVPLKYAIDADHCIYFKNGKCRACEKFCPANAVDFSQQETIETVDVGAVVLAPGFHAYDPSHIVRYGYGTLKNVVTSMEFERILSASGPFEGHLVRPSDHQEPRKIAWLQCIGSRDIREDSHPYCSGVCCMYAIKEALVAKEHAGAELDTAIFYMDMRTHGKGFEQTYNRAKEESGVRFIRARVHSIEPETDDRLKVTYVTDSGLPQDEVFDLVVLSVGMEIDAATRELARKLDISLDGDGFCRTHPFAPVTSSRPGVFVCGAFAGVKDIPQTVMEASAAAAGAAGLLATARNTAIPSEQKGAEPLTLEDTPRIGVFICHCGTNIAGVVDVQAVKAYAETLPDVAFATTNLFTCSADTQASIRQAIVDNRLNRVVVAACTPRTHEALFQETIQEAGLNPYLFEFANIRDQNAWVHQNQPEEATRKAKDLVRMAVAKARLLEPIDPLSISVNKNALVIGGGAAGMSAALGLADQGFETILVERDTTLGGNARLVHQSWNGHAVAPLLDEMIQRVSIHPAIRVLHQSTIQSVEGFVGNFVSTVQTPQGLQHIEHGAVVVATGAHPFRPAEYLYGSHPRVSIWHELDERLESDPAALASAKGIAYIQCVGSREPQRPACSRICCTATLQSAIRWKTAKPDLRVFVLYRDIRSYGQREALYQQARELGVIFIRYDLEHKPQVQADTNGGLLVTVHDPILDRPIEFPVDYLNLATAIVAPEGQETLAQMLKVPLTEDGFFLEAHVKLRPVDFATDGVFVCGLAHYPKSIDESIAQGQAAAARAATLLVQETIDIAPIVSVVNEDKCIGCGLCEASCSFGAIRLKKVVGKGYRAENLSALCKGCGVCAASCPQQAIDMKHFRKQQIEAAICARAVAGA